MECAASGTPGAECGHLLDFRIGDAAWHCFVPLLLCNRRNADAAAHWQFCAIAALPTQAYWGAVCVPSVAIVLCWQQMSSCCGNGKCEDGT
jgi:hypothetical protein